MKPHGVVDLDAFFDVVVEGYNRGTASCSLPADVELARSIIPPATGRQRDFSYIAPELPEFLPAKCVGCMECVTACPDTALLARVAEASTVAGDPSAWSRTKKYADNFETKGQPPGLFRIFVDPTKCKGCAECVDVCGDRAALKMIPKSAEGMARAGRAMEEFYALKETPSRYVLEKSLMDIMLTDRALLYVGGAGSCMGCGEGTAVRMMLAATGFVHGPEGVAIVASTGCNTVFGSTYPFNPYRVAWMNSLFENAPTVAMGVRAAWDLRGWKEKRLWVIGGDGAMNDIGFQSLSRLLMSGMDIKVLVLDTQVYSNTGGQASGSTFVGQATSFTQSGKSEARKEIGLLALMHGNVYVAQTTPAHTNHFYRAVMEANAFPGPALVNVYASCMPEHGIADDMGYHQSKFAVESRAFPLFTYDPRKGDAVSQRLDIKTNPAWDKDWWTRPKTGEVVDWVSWARSERRFAKHFDAAGKGDAALLAAQDERLRNWRRIQELAGVRP